MTSNISETLRALFERRISRRRLIGNSCEIAAFSLLAGRGWAVEQSPLGFRRVTPSKEDSVIVPDGYSAKTVIRWGDALFGDVTSLDANGIGKGLLLQAGAVDAQARQFGYNCDGIGLFPLDERRLLMCVNHEFPSPALMFPGWDEARRARTLGAFVTEHPECVAYMQAAVGLSVVELDNDGEWRYRIGSRYNRRITAHTPIEISGPARLHPLLNARQVEVPLAFGTFGNCAAGTTPWGTYLTAEENVDDYFGNAGATQFEPALANVHKRFGSRARDSAYRWEYADPRFDAAVNPAESLKFGWIVELDPADPHRPLKKRTALGRFKHECATTVLAGDGRVVVYMGDDQQFEYFYKFVTAGRFDPNRPRRNRDLLDSGTLYVARFFDDGHGEWLPLVWGEHTELTPERGFASQGDVVLRCREAADRVGATALDRPEDVAVNPRTGNVYVACTQNLNRDGGVIEVAGRQVDTSTDAVNPRAPNSAGQIVELAESGSDAVAATFRWEIFLLAGAPTPDSLRSTLTPERRASMGAEVTYFGGYTDVSELSAFANPDNLTFDDAGNLWIVTDGLQPGDNNNGCFVCPTEGAGRGHVRQFMSGPVGAEICGCEITADGRTLFLTIQHPGTGGSVAAPVSHWPDGGEAAPRPSLVAIQSSDDTRKLGE
ncbi:MAG TPA: PhoX family phosphatase [Gammaproteobacteria bacterium]|nr:PhoX family phosphatase [Gammaproteobacteria bacterium]